MSHLCPLDHLVAGAESFLHHGSNLLSFKLQLLPDQIHLQGKLQETQRGESPLRHGSDVASSTVMLPVCPHRVDPRKLGQFL